MWCLPLQGDPKVKSYAIINPQKSITVSIKTRATSCALFRTRRTSKVGFGCPNDSISSMGTWEVQCGTAWYRLGAKTSNLARGG
jgi:hypothetical protein